jgi:hypothetical protein
MAALLLAIGVGVVLSGSPRTPPQPGALSDATTADARRAVLAGLRDPESARFANVAVNGRGIVCGTINARNGFGGYTGAAGFYYDPSDRRAVIADLSGDWEAKGYQAVAFEAVGCSIGAEQQQALDAHRHLEASYARSEAAVKALRKN